MLTQLWTTQQYPPPKKRHIRSISVHIYSNLTVPLTYNPHQREQYLYVSSFVPFLGAAILMPEQGRMTQ